MNAAQVWESVRTQLLLDMSKATFDRWLRDTEAASLEEEALTVRAPREEAREWLEARLTSTIERMLVGILNRRVTVQFVAEQSSHEDQEEPEVLIEPVQWLDYESIVQPHRQVVVKGYLRRLGAEIGAKAVWLYIGFHQAAWLTHDAGGNTGSVLHSREIMRFSGLSFGAFWRALKQPDIQQHLRGLVQRIDPPNARRYRRGRDGRPHRLPIRYQVFMTPRLTCADGWAVNARLKTLLGQGATLKQALQQCLDVEDALELLRTEKLTSDTPPPHTVMDIARTASAAPLSKEADRLAQELHRRIINSLGDVYITHYFITHVIRKFQLTPAQAWLATVARDMAYINSRTGERREAVNFRGGYQEMAELVGSKRPKTIQAWFNPSWGAHRWGGDLRRFMGEISAPQTDRYADLRAESMPRTFKVLLDEPLDADGSNSVGADGSNRLDATGTNRLDADGSNMVGANGTVKNSCKHPLSTQREDTSSADDPHTVEVAAPASWELKTLLQQNHVHPKVQRELLQAQVSGQAFVSWVLFAAGHEGKWISGPLGHAISRLRAEPGSGAGGAFEELATLQPKDLQNLIDLALEDPLGFGPHAEHRYEKTWREAMSSNLHSLMTVRTILFGKGGLA